MLATTVGSDTGFARHTLKVRVPEASRLRSGRMDEVAGSIRDELTNNRRSGLTRSEPQTKGASHGPYCDRLGRKGIPGLCDERARRAAGREACCEPPTRAVS